MGLADTGPVTEQFVMSELHSDKLVWAAERFGQLSSVPHCDDALHSPIRTTISTSSRTSRANHVHLACWVRGEMGGAHSQFEHHVCSAV